MQPIVPARSSIQMSIEQLAEWFGDGCGEVCRLWLARFRRVVLGSTGALTKSIGSTGAGKEEVRLS